jgi:hypothetical protein
MKSLDQSDNHQRRMPLLEWHRWFAWYPVPIMIDEEQDSWIARQQIRTAGTKAIKQRTRSVMGWHSGTFT